MGFVDSHCPGSDVWTSATPVNFCAHGLYSHYLTCCCPPNCVFIFSVMQKCTFKVDYTLENIPGREFGSVFINNNNVALKVASDGWAKVSSPSHTLVIDQIAYPSDNGPGGLLKIYGSCMCVAGEGGWRLPEPIHRAAVGRHKGGRECTQGSLEQGGSASSLALHDLISSELMAVVRVLSCRHMAVHSVHGLLVLIATLQKHELSTDCAI